MRTAAVQDERVACGDGDPLQKLIKRAEAFRNTLNRVSTRHRLLKSDDSDLLLLEGADDRGFRFRKLVDTLLSSDDDDSLELSRIWREQSQETENAADEAALLQELFFSQGHHAPASKDSSSQTDAKQDQQPQQKKIFSTEKSFDDEGLRLLVTIGKVVLLEPAVKDFTKLKQSILGHLGNTTSILPNCTCLLTLFFPAIFDAHGVKLCPEQRISISPTQIQKRMLVFDYRSQLFWKLASGKAQDEWWIQPVKTTLYARWQSGEALECYGYILLKNAVGRAPGGFQTSLVLIGEKAFEELKHDMKSENRDPAVKTTRLKSKPTSESVDMEGKPIAIVDIGMTLMGESTPCSPKQVTCSVQTQEEQEPWIYLNLHSVADFFCKLTGRQSMPLVVKSGSRVTFGSIRSPSHKFGRCLDVVLKPVSNSECLVFLEVWKSLRAYECLGEEGLEDLAGMLKVPYSSESWKERKTRHGTVKCSGSFKVWHPSDKSISGKVAMVVVLGLRAQILRIQKENQAAARIQHFFRLFFSAKVGKPTVHRQRPPRNNIKFPDNETANSSGKASDCGPIKEGKIQKETYSLHLFEVSIQKLVGFPEEKFDAHRGPSQPNKKVFIKYTFPGELEPFYSHESEWLQTIVFEAYANHKISLPSASSVCSYIQAIDRKCEGIRFEIWQVDAQNSSEEHFGSAGLCQRNLVNMVNLNRHDQHKSRRVFELPISIHANWLSRMLSDPKLIVEIAYQHVVISGDFLKGTIFADDSLIPTGAVEASLDVRIIRAKGLQNALDTIVSTNATWQGRLNPYVRFSLFPSNKELELLYPPSVTPFKENTIAPLFDCCTAFLITLTAEVLEELKKSKMNFEVWHHSSKARNNSSSIQSSETDIWLATASAPCPSLLTDKKGVNGWLTLVSRRGGMVGKLEVAVRFSSWKSLH